MKKKLTGKVVSDKMEKTVTVLVDRYVKHQKYKKYFKTSDKYKAHDENKEFKIGDKIVIEECAPISKDKRFKAIKKI